ncbi:hypothetical protein P7L53_02210 [Thermoleptolyngbya sichuanensis XZ-Cy5]|uniref:hypothetical protein n=1 Tax=Thermoleptolyngbya sichuanensis TaxID=2885951 RepID=UPI00240DADB9|nr:hypothetical protein [Thermoleptolyngbya sichuanensis]MDG2615049.1 hypothetical protein [Thermoleptolyngbya sichuanensis XZ-Cy5]
MLMAVVVLNFSLALFGLYAAGWVWRLGRGLRQVADTLTRAERQTYRTLQGAPVAIAQGQTHIEQLRQQLQQVGPQVQRLRQAIALVSLAQSLWFGGWGFGIRRRAKAKAVPKQARQSQSYRGRGKSRD